MAAVALALMSMSAASDFVVHLSPVWRERSDFIIKAAIEEDDSPRRYEQLWARRLGETRFEICCIPFFVYDLALGDEVDTDSVEYLIKRVLKSSGRYTFRVWFGDSDHAGARDEVIEHVREIGCDLEWYSENLLAVDAADDGLAQRVADFLQERERLGHLVFETGRTA